MSFAPVGVNGAGLMQCFDVATAAQSGVPVGDIIGASDTQGFYYTTDRGGHWAVRNNGAYPPGHSKAHQIAAVIWSSQEIGPTGISAIYALTGDAANNGAATGGGLLVSLDGSKTWSMRSTAVMAGANINAPPLPQFHPGGWPRPAGRLLCEDSTYLYAATYGNGVMRSNDHGRTWPVTFTMGGRTATQGAFYCFALFLDSSGTLWLGTWGTTAANGGLWKCTNPQAATPNFTQVTLPAATGQLNNASPTVADILVLDGVTYICCGNAGLWSNGGGSWADLNGNGTGSNGGLDVTPGNSGWVTVDGYLDGSGNHQLLVSCANPVKNAGDRNFECIAKVTVASHGTGAATWRSLTANATITLDPIPNFGYSNFLPTNGLCLGFQGYTNPQIRWDVNDPTHQNILLTADEGMFVSTDGGNSWTVANNGMPGFLGHSCACDPNHAGYMLFASSDWAAWQVSDGVGIGGATADSQATIQHMTPGGQAYAFTYDPVDSTAYVCYGTGKYGAGTGDVKSKAYNTWSWGSSLNPPFTNVPMGACAFRDGSGTKWLLVAVEGDGIYRYNASTGTWASTPVLAGFGSGGAPNLHYPMVYAGGGIIYAANRNGALYRSSNYGASGSWTNIWPGVAGGTDIAVNPFHQGELWVSDNTGIYKLTSADTGASVGSGITKSGPFTGTNNEVVGNACIAFDQAGNLYCAVSDTGSGTGLFQCAGNSTVSPDGNTWTDVVGDASFAQCNGNPENMAIGPDGRIYVSGSNAVVQGFPGTSSSIVELQNGANLGSAVGGSLSLYFNQSGAAPSLAGDTLIARIELGDGSGIIGAPAGWVLDVDKASGTATSGIARVQIWRYANAPAGAVGTTLAAAAVFTQTGSAILKGRITEYQPSVAGQVIYLDQTGSAGAAAAVTSMPVTASAANTVAGGLAVAMFGAAFSPAPTSQTWTTPAGWTNDGVANNATGVFSAFSQTGITTGPASITGTISTSVGMAGWAAALATYYAAAPQTLRVTTRTLSAATEGTAYSRQLQASGGVQPYTWTRTSGNLPAGLSFTSAGLLAGTPSQTGTFPLTFQVADQRGNTVTATLSLTVNSSGPVLPPSAPFLLGIASSPSTASLTVNVGQPTNPNDNIIVGVALNTAGVTPSVTDSQGNTYAGTVSDSVNAGAKVWTFESANAGALALTDTLVIALTGASAIVAIAVDDPDGAAGNDAAVAAHGSSTAPSVSTGSFAAPVEQNCVAFVVDTNAGGVPSWAAAWSPLATAGDGGSHLYLSVAALQKSSLSPTSITASATIVSAPWAMALICEQINAPTTTTVLSDGVVGDLYSQSLQATGGLAPYTWATSGLPPGLTLTGSTVSGTPTTAGTYLVTITPTDSFGFATPTVQTVNIIGAPPASAAVQPMPANLLKAADAYPAAGFTWQAARNGNAPQLSSHALAGTDSLFWTAAAAGSTTIISGEFPATAQAPYIASVYLMTSSNLGPSADVGIDWFDRNDVFISASVAPAPFAEGPGNWQGIQLATVAPAGAVTGALYVGVDTANAGDTTTLGLAFVAQTGAQVLIDFQNPAFAPGTMAGSNWADVSPWLRLDQNINISRGRQSAISEISTGSASFSLQNDAGYFTPSNGLSLISVLGGTVTLAGRCQINLADENGVWSTRFDGPVSQVNYTLDPTGNTNLAQVYCADILAALSRQDGMNCWTREQILADGPLYHWALDDYTQAQAQQQSHSTQTVQAQQASFLAAESSGNSGPPLKVTTRDRTAKIAWADTSGGVETLADAAQAGSPGGGQFWPAGSNLPTSNCRGLISGTVGPFSTPSAGIYLTPKLTAGAGMNLFNTNIGYTLSAALPQALTTAASGDFTVEAWFTLDPNVSANGTMNYGPYIVFSLGSTRGSHVICAGAYQANSTIPNVGATFYGSAPGFASLNFSGLTISPSSTVESAMPSGADTVQRPHHLVLAVQGDTAAPTATVYVDNIVIGTLLIPAGLSFDQFVVGGAYAGGGGHYGGVQLVSIYDYLLSPQQVSLHCQLGQYGMWEAPTDDCIAQLATYAGIPAFWNNISAQHNGLSLTDYYDITGSTPYSAMTVYEQTEGGLLYVPASGQLSLHTRDWRMGYGTPKMAFPPGAYSEQLGLEIIDSYQENENAVASVAYPGGSAFINQSSKQRYGTYATNAARAPLQVPLISWSRAFSRNGLNSLANYPDPTMEDAAAWPANTRSDPWLAPGGVLIDLLSIDPSWGFSISDVYSLEIDDCITFSGGLPISMPDQPGAVDWFVEGVVEVYGLNARSIQFYGSPADPQRAWIPADPVYGVLGSTTRVGVSSTDLSTPPADGKAVSHDGGPPFWALPFSTNMNASSADTRGFVGANDMRGLTWPLEQALRPPMMLAGIVTATQNIASGSITQPQVYLDTVFCDTQNGMGILPSWPNWYVCLSPGFYEIDATLPWQGVASGAGAGNQAWLVVARQAALNLAIPNTTLSPLLNGSYSCPIGETVRQNSVSVTNYCAPSTRLYLGLGDMVTLAVEHDATGSRTIVANAALSIRYVALSTADDACQLNSSIASGGTVFQPPSGAVTTKTYKATHTFAHYGSGANTPYGLRNEDGNVYQGVPTGGAKTFGSQFSLIRFDWTTIHSDLVGKTIKSVTLDGTCTDSYYSTGMTLLGGYYYTNNESSAWHPPQQATPPDRNLWTQQFKRGQEKTFQLDSTLFQLYFVGKTAHGIIVGTDATSNVANYGRFTGGPNSWTLVVTYQ